MFAFHSIVIVTVSLAPYETCSRNLMQRSTRTLVFIPVVVVTVVSLSRGDLTSEAEGKSLDLGYRFPCFSHLSISVRPVVVNQATGGGPGLFSCLPHKGGHRKWVSSIAHYVVSRSTSSSWPHHDKPISTRRTQAVLYNAPL